MTEADNNSKSKIATAAMVARAKYNVLKKLPKDAIERNHIQSY